MLPREVFAGFREMVVVDEGAVAICTQQTTASQGESKAITPKSQGFFLDLGSLFLYIFSVVIPVARYHSTSGTKMGACLS